MTASSASGSTPSTSDRGRDGIRLVDPRDLVSSWEIAERLGVSQDLVLKWYQRGYGMPTAVHSVGRRRQIKLWFWPDVERWALNSGVLVAPSTPEDPVTVADELVTGAELAKRLGWKDPGTALKLWRQGNEFPAPVNRYGRVWVWRWSDAQRWDATTPRRPNRRNSPAT